MVVGYEGGFDRPFRHDFVVPPFSPKTGTPLSLRDISPDRGITFQGRQADDILKLSGLFSAPLKGELAKSLVDFD